MPYLQYHFTGPTFGVAVRPTQLFCENWLQFVLGIDGIGRFGGLTSIQTDRGDAQKKKLIKGGWSDPSLLAEVLYCTERRRRLEWYR